MQFNDLVTGTLVKRYKRFLADVTLDSGEVVTVHCPNTGAMTGCAEPGSRVWLSISKNPKRKYVHTWELVQTAAGDLACIHSVKANTLVREAIEAGIIKELAGYERILMEVRFGSENSRVDLLLEQGNNQCFVEVKSVTLLVEDGLGVFPDAISERASRHLRELIAMKKRGHRAVLFFCVQHTGITQVAPADLIDSRYAETFREALVEGVEVLAYRANISPHAMMLDKPLQVLSRQPSK